MLSVLYALLLLLQQPMPLVVTLDVSPETPEGQRQISMRAVEACRGKYPQLDRYTFSGASGPDGGARAQFTYRGEVTCIDGPPPRPEGVPVPADWRPSAADETRVRDATLALFAATDRGDAAAIEGMMSQGYRATATPESRAQQLLEFRAEAGAPGAHRVIRVTWYLNPPGVLPGAYAAVDYDRSYANLAANCGYAVWHRQADGRFLLVREETGSAPLAVSASPERLAELRRMLQCRD